MRLEPEMWDGLREICQREHSTLHAICTAIAADKRDLSSLTASIRVYVMRYFRLAATEDGHARAGHGSVSNVIALPRIRHEKPLVSKLTATSFS